MMEEAAFAPPDWILQDHEGNLLSTTRTKDETCQHPPIRLSRAKAPTRAYAWIDGDPCIPLSHAPDWGVVHYAVVYPRVPLQDNNTNDEDAPFTFVAPREEEAQLVAVKVLNKAVVDPHVAAGLAENPYREICRLQQLGDNIHVIRCIEVLEDEDHLFIVTPLGTTFDRVVYGQTLSAPEIHAYFMQMLRTLCFLEEHCIHQRDLKPQNFVILPSGELVLIDMAMSLRMPIDRTGRPRRLQRTGSFGTPGYLAPEIFRQEPSYDGVAADLWNLHLMLYEMSTGGTRLYKFPLGTDWNYVYFCYNHGLREPLTDLRVLEAFVRTKSPPPEARALLVQTATTHRQRPVALRELMSHGLCHRQEDRWTLEQVLKSEYVRQPPQR